MRYTQSCKHRKVCNVVDQRIKLETKKDHIQTKWLKQECTKTTKKYFVDRYEYIKNLQLKHLC